MIAVSVGFDLTMRSSCFSTRQYSIINIQYLNSQINITLVNKQYETNNGQHQQQYSNQLSIFNGGTHIERWRLIVDK